MVNESTVFVVDSDPLARNSVLALVGKRGLPAAEFAAAEDFLAQYDPARQGCLVIDLRMADFAGLKLLKKIAAGADSPPVIAVADSADVPMAVRAMQAGAFTFLPRPYQEQELCQALSHALETENSRHAPRVARIQAETRLLALTADEREVFRRLLAGHANKRISVDLDIGLRTVELRRANIMKKMHATSLPDLVRLAILVDFFPTDALP